MRIERKFGRFDAARGGIQRHQHIGFAGRRFCGRGGEAENAIVRNAVFVSTLGVEHRVTERRIRRQAVCLKDGFGGLRRDLGGLLVRDFVAARLAQGCALVAPRVFGLIVGRPAKQVGTEFLRPRFASALAAASEAGCVARSTGECWRISPVSASTVTENDAAVAVNAGHQHEIGVALPLAGYGVFVKGKKTLVSQTDSKQARAACRASCSVSARSGVAAGGALAVAATVAAGERMGSLPGRCGASFPVSRRKLPDRECFIIEIEDGTFTVLATGGDTHLGGDDFDQRIVEYAVAEFKKSDRIDLSRDPAAMGRLKEEAEKAKKELSAAPSAQLNLPFIAVGKDGPHHWISRCPAPSSR